MKLAKRGTSRADSFQPSEGEGEGGKRTRSDGAAKWSTPLFEPIALPGGRNLITLGDAVNYVAALPAREQARDHWQAAAHALMLSSRAGDGLLAWRRSGAR